MSEAAPWAWMAGITTGAALCAWASIRLLLPVLRAKALDRPNARSSHIVPTPRGGGIGILAAVLPGWAAASWLLASKNWAELATLSAATGLAVVSWRDDRHSLRPLARFAVQATAVIVGLLVLPADLLGFGGVLPLGLDRLVTGLSWLWFINLFNFMDGIDGLAGCEIVSICLGLIVLAGLGVADDLRMSEALILLGASAGFLVWNRPPAKVFLGDVGSAPLGYLIGWLLVNLWLAGHWAPAVILPLYFVADATATLVRRLVRGERPWQAHRDHFYQLAVRRGYAHAEVTGRVALLNVTLVGLAGAAVRYPWLSLAAALLLTGMIFAVFSRGKAQCASL